MESWPHCRSFVRDVVMEIYEGNGGKEDSMFLEITCVIYLFISGLFVGMLVLWFFFLLNQLLTGFICKEHDVLINSKNTKLFAELWHF